MASNNFLVLFGVSCFAVSACAPTYQNASTKSVYEFHGLDAYGPVPASLTQNVTCPGIDHATPTASIDGKNFVYKASPEIDYSKVGWENRVSANWDAFSGLGFSQSEILAIDIRRVGGKPHYLYLANGRAAAEKLSEPWSASKFMAAAAAGVRVRTDSKGKVGLNSWTFDSKLGKLTNGDRITSIHTYSQTNNVTGNSNSLAYHFLNVAGRDFATALLNEKWLRLSKKNLFFGKYGDVYSQPSSKEWFAANGGSQVVNNSVTSLGEKSMSVLAMGEFLKRLTQHETDPNTRAPALQKEDVQTLFYGDLSATGKIGGMLAGESVYVAQGLMGGKKVGRAGSHGGAENAAAKDRLDKQTKGQWRIFHKLGAGTSSSRGVSEIVMATYVCLPQWNGGREFVIVTNTHQSSLGKANTVTEKIFNAVIGKLAPGF